MLISGLIVAVEWKAKRLVNGVDTCDLTLEAKDICMLYPIRDEP